jgi:CheY-like chemotaxis protein
MLAELGAIVAGVATTAEALLHLKAEIPDVLVSDLGLPVEDGFALIRKVRALSAASGGKLPAIALTAFARTEDRVRALQSGFQAHVSKPVEPAELAAVIASLAAKPGPKRRLPKPKSSSSASGPKKARSARAKRLR